MKFSIYQTSHQGGRAKNEDRMGYCHTAESILLLLADGMGGHPEGEMASQIAIQTIATLFQKLAAPALDDVPTFLESALLMAHRQILRYAIDRSMSDSPRTTLVAVVIQNGMAQWVHCGDSRLYLIRNKAVLSRTRDHSYSELRDSIIAHVGKINRNVLFTCLGSPARPIYDLSKPEPLHQGDRIMLCSDGLWGSLSDESILQHFSTGHIQQASHAVVDLAFEAAGKNSDNITVVALDWQEPRAARDASSRLALDDDYADVEGFTSTISGGLLDDVDIERSLSDISDALHKSRGDH